MEVAVAVADSCPFLVQLCKLCATVQGKLQRVHRARNGVGVGSWMRNEELGKRHEEGSLNAWLAGKKGMPDGNC